MLQDQSDCESTDLARVRRWTRGRVTVGQCLRVHRSRRREWRRVLDGEMVLGGQAHEVLLPLGAATIVTLAWTDPLGAVTTVTPTRTVSLGAATTVAPAWIVNLWAHL